MKCLVLFIVLIAIFFANADPITRKVGEFMIDGILGQFFEKLREFIKQGDPQLGIPILDPYEFEFAHVEFPESLISLSSNISHGCFAGLADFQMLQFDFIVQELALEFDIYFPSLNISAEYYEMEGDIMEALPLAGRGILHNEVYDLNIRSKVYLKQSENQKSILVDRFEKPQFSINRVVSKTAFDNNIDDIFNAMIEDLLAGYLNRCNKYLAAKYSGTIINALNTILAKFESW